MPLSDSGSGYFGPENNEDDAVIKGNDIIKGVNKIVKNKSGVSSAMSVLWGHIIDLVKLIGLLIGIM